MSTTLLRLKSRILSVRTRSEDTGAPSFLFTWCEDEQRLGLQPTTRRVWTEKGSQPLAAVKTKYQWLWLYGFVHPESGESYFWILPKVNTKLFSLVLADLAQ